MSGPGWWSDRCKNQRGTPLLPKIEKMVKIAQIWAKNAIKIAILVEKSIWKAPQDRKITQNVD